MTSVISPVQSHYHEGSPVGKRRLRREGFVEKQSVTDYFLKVTSTTLHMTEKYEDKHHKTISSEHTAMDWRKAMRCWQAELETKVSLSDSFSVQHSILCTLPAHITSPQQSAQNGTVRTDFTSIT